MQWSFVPTMVIVGLPDAAVQESRARVQAAIKNAGLCFIPSGYFIISGRYMRLM